MLVKLFQLKQNWTSIVLFCIHLYEDKQYYIKTYFRYYWRIKAGNDTHSFYYSLYPM